MEKGYVSFCTALPPNGIPLSVLWSDVETLGLRYGDLVHLFLPSGQPFIVNLSVPYSDKTFQWKIRESEALFIEKQRHLEIAHQVIYHYGLRHQLVKTLEELGECTAEISRAVSTHLNGDLISPELATRIASEIADCEFLFEQLGLVGNWRKLIDRQRLAKEERQLGRIKAENERFAR